MDTINIDFLKKKNWPKIALNASQPRQTIHEWLGQVCTVVFKLTEGYTILNDTIAKLEISSVRREVSEAAKIEKNIIINGVAVAQGNTEAQAEHDRKSATNVPKELGVDASKISRITRLVKSSSSTNNNAATSVNSASANNLRPPSLLVVLTDKESKICP